MIVLREFVRAIDTDFAFRQAVGDVESEEFNGGAPVGRDFHFLGFDRLAVGDQRDFARGFVGVIARDGGYGADLFRVENAARRIDAFDGPVGNRFVGNGMHDEFGAVVEPRIGERGGPGET